MKKYLIICETKKSADKVNDFIAVSSLFAEGETITEPVAFCGSLYTDDNRVYNAVLAYIQNGGVDVRAYNLREFYVRNFHVEINDDKIIVDGHSMTLDDLRSTHFRLRSLFHGGNYNQALSLHLQRNDVYALKLCNHIVTYRKICA